MKNYFSVNYEKTILYVFTLIFSFCLIQQLNFALELKVSGLLTFLLSILFIAMFVSLSPYVKFSRKVTAYTSGTIAALLLIGLPFGFDKKAFSAVRNFFIWCYDYINKYENIVIKYQYTLIILISILISLLTVLLVAKKRNLVFILSTGMLIHAMVWANELPFNYMSFYIFVLSIIVYYFIHVYFTKSTNSNNYSSLKYSLIWMITVCAVVFIASYKIPSPSLPIQFPLLDNKINALFSEDESWSYDFFSFNRTGYSNKEKKLGGKLEQDNTPVLQINTPVNIYLKGNSMDYYDGTKWSSTDKTIYPIDDQYNGINNEIFELENGAKFLDLYSNDLLKSLLSKRNIEIKYLKLRTKTVFYPSKTENISPVQNKKIFPYVNADSSLLSKKFLPGDFSYSVQSYFIDYSRFDFKLLLIQSHKGLYENVSSLPNGISNSDLEKLKNISNNVYSKYLQIPENFSTRIRDLTNTITGSNGVPDYSKAKGIELYLTNNFTYTLEPKDTPKGTDFVENFLFNTKEGYCTYYATAMTMMLRSIGIPARYVEGYMLPPDAEPGTTFTVTNKNAHAWVEAYFEGFGWIPFEPTSPFTNSFYYRRIEQDQSNTQAEDSTGEETLFYEGPDELSSENYVSGSGETVPANNFITDVSNKHYSSVVTKIMVIIALIIVFIIALAAFLYTNSRKASRRLQASFTLPTRESIISMYSFYLQILAILDLPIMPNESSLQYADRIHKHEILEQVDIIELTNIFVKARYGKSDIEFSQKRFVYRLNEDFLEIAKKNLNKLRFFTYRYLLGNI